MELKNLLESLDKIRENFEVGDPEEDLLSGDLPYTPCEEYGHRFDLDGEEFASCIDCGAPNLGLDNKKPVNEPDDEDILDGHNDWLPESKSINEDESLLNPENIEDENTEDEEDCNYCGGTGEQFAECPGGCNGKGCEICHGLGYDDKSMVPCEDCEGTGKKKMIKEAANPNEERMPNQSGGEKNTEFKKIPTVVGATGRQHSKASHPGFKDANADLVKKLGETFFNDKPYSIARIGKNGEYRRFSFATGVKGWRFLQNRGKGPDVISSLPKAPKEVLDKLRQIKKAFIQTCLKAGIPEGVVDVKFHIGTGLYASVMVKLGAAKKGPEKNNLEVGKKAEQDSSFVGKGIYESKKPLNESFSWSLNVDSTGRKSVSVNADEENADQLLSILRLSGITGESIPMPVTEEKVEVDYESAGEHVNEPDEQILDAHTQLIDLSGGLNKPHEQVNPFNRGDNSMTLTKSDAMESLQTTLHNKFKKMVEDKNQLSIKDKECPKCSSSHVSNAGDKKGYAHCEECEYKGLLKKFPSKKVGKLGESAAPGQEEWIKKNKQHFIDEYGKEKGLEVLYATAWKRHNEDLSESSTERSSSTFKKKGII